MERSRFAPVILAVCAIALGACSSDTPAVVTDASAADGSPTADATTDTSVPDTGVPDADASPTFTVKGLPGLALWLDASQGVTQSNNAVSAWADQSGNGNNATQAAAGYQPTLLASGIGGKPSIHFGSGSDGGASSGTHLSVADAVTLQWGTGDFYMAVVLRTTNLADGLIFSKQNPTAYPFPGPSLWASLGLPSASTAWGGLVDYTHYVRTGTVALNNNAPRQFSFARTATTLNVRLNGAPDGTTTSDAGIIDISSVGKAAFIGANVAGAQLLTGDIGELIAVKGSISAEDVASVEAYLKTKYSL